jgi:hypothetical protein
MRSMPDPSGIPRSISATSTPSSSPRASSSDAAGAGYCQDRLALHQQGWAQQTGHPELVALPAGLGEVVTHADRRPAAVVGLDLDVPAQDLGDEIDRH